MFAKTLIPSLLTDHVNMRAALEDARRHGIATAEGQRRLREVRQLIVDHLRREDAELYPALRACTETQKLADTYASEMQELSREILAFFDGMAGEHDDLVFARGFGKVMGTLNKRWTREEVRLYPAYDQQCNTVRKAS